MELVTEIEPFVCPRCHKTSHHPKDAQHGYCGHCHWAVRAEVEEGLYAFREYLRAWARFDEWCVSHGAKAA